jgi:diaminohydroxyphosphoribosylaminopyrimidine deaminase / 5-amino-6-(5-phosphoribosylamino)uracil reductase
MANETDKGAADEAWAWILAAARAIRGSFDPDLPHSYAFDDSLELVPVAPSDSRACIAWIPWAGWVSKLSADARQSPMLDLYLPFASGHSGAPLVIGHLGQSLDGFIATTAGDSCYVTGDENVSHLHRMRALCDAVIVGAGTVAADDPQLTTRRVTGHNPLRVVIDRTRRLDDQYRVFNDGQAPTLLVCGESARDAWPAKEQVEILRVPTPGGQLDLAVLIAVLRSRGCARIFVEGGGVTVSSFLEAQLLDRLQIAVAPLLIGEGRPAIRLPGKEALSDCARPQQRIFRLGEDILFECILGASTFASQENDDEGTAPIARVL